MVVFVDVICNTGHQIWQKVVKCLEKFKTASNMILHSISCQIIKSYWYQSLNEVRLMIIGPTVFATVLMFPGMLGTFGLLGTTGISKLLITDISEEEIVLNRRF